MLPLWINLGARKRRLFIGSDAGFRATRHTVEEGV